MSHIKPILRSWKNNKGFVIQVISMFALGIGANVAVFSFLNAALLDLPFQNANELVTVWSSNPQLGQSETFASALDVADWNQQTGAFSGMSLYDSGTATLQTGDLPTKIPIGTVSAKFFEVLRASPAVGRTFDAGKQESLQAVLSYRIWKEHFHEDTAIINNLIRLDDRAYIVVGVAPQNFHLFEDVGIWVPVQLTEGDSARASRHFTVIARLKSSNSLAQAQSELDVVARRLQKQYPDTNAGWNISAVPLRSYLFRNLKSSFVLISITAGLVLLIACFNVASLFLLYVDSKQRESAIRLALGCSRATIRLQFVMELLALAMAGCAIGLVVAIVMVRWVGLYAPKTLLPSGPHLNLEVYIFGLVVAFIAALIPSALIFLWRSEQDLNGIIKGVPSTAIRKSVTAPRQVFLVFEIAMSVLLLISAVLMTKSFVALHGVDPGFNPHHLLTARIELPEANYSSKVQQSNLFEQLLMSLESRQELKNVAAVTGIPLAGSRMSFRFSLPESDSPQFTQGAEYRAVSPGYFHVLGISVLQGREFSETDRSATQPVVIINEALSHRFFRDRNPIGQHLLLTYGLKKPLTIIGVVRNVKISDLAEAPRYELYVPYLQNPWPFMTLVIEPTGSLESIIPTLRHALSLLDKDLPVEDIRSMDQVIYESMTRPRFAMFLILLFSVLAVVMSMQGMYSVMSFVVSHRTREIGVRMAMGASNSSISSLFVRQALWIMIGGLVLGVLASFFTTSIFRGLLYTVKPMDWQVNSIAMAFIVVVGFLGCFIPVRRATRVDPIVVLRSE
jgi:putative ABC transport system permease protein